MPSPEVSVVICAYTAARSDALLEAVASLRQQSNPPCQVIVVVDHNRELLHWLRSHAPDVVAIENAEQPGLAGARNTGLHAARGEVVAFLDDDAVAAPDWIERLAAGYRDLRVIGVGGAVMPAWEGQRPHWLPEEFQWVVGCSYRGLPRERSAVRNFIGCNMSFRREVFEQVGGFTRRLGRVGSRPLGCEETELCIRISRHVPDRVLLYDPAARVHHRVPSERVTWKYFLARCHAEGISKAEVARLSGRAQGLASERAYARRTLPAGVWAAVRAARPARAIAIVVGLATTATGFATGFATGAAAGAEAGAA